MSFFQPNYEGQSLGSPFAHFGLDHGHHRNQRPVHGLLTPLGFQNLLD